MKKFAHKIAVCGMCAVLAATTLAGCGGASSGSSAAPANAASGTTSTAGADGEYPVLRMGYRVLFEVGSENEAAVEDALNEILREKANAELDLIAVQAGSYSTQMNLLLTGGDESLDIFTSYSFAPLSTLKANGQVAALDDLMDSEAPELKALFADYSEVLDCARIDGVLYGIPTITVWSNPNMFIVKKTDSDNANIDWSQVHTIEDMTQAMLDLKAANPDAHYVPGSTQTYWLPKTVDYLGDTNFLGVLTDPTNSTTIENYYESDYFLNFLEQVKIWKENDIISADPLSNSDPTLLNLQTGVVNGTPGYGWSVEDSIYQYTQSQQFGDDIVGCQLGDRIMTTNDVTQYMYHISTFCEEPEAAMRILNVLYTDPDAANLIANGVEGMHYQIDENGRMAYLEGKDISNSGWTSQSMPLFPNSTLCPLWDFQQENTNELREQANQEALKSLALGFSFDSSEVADQITACANVVSQYYLPLMYAEVDIDETLPVFQQALHDAGIDDIIQAKQEQLDAWLASK